MKNTLIILSLITSFAACKPGDDLPCNGMARDVYYDVEGQDTIYVPFTSVDTFKYRRTIFIQVR